MNWAQVDVFTSGKRAGEVQTTRDGGWHRHPHVGQWSLLRLARVFAKHQGTVCPWGDGWAWYFEGDDS